MAKINTISKSPPQKNKLFKNKMKITFPFQKFFFLFFLGLFVLFSLRQINKHWTFKKLIFESGLKYRNLVFERFPNLPESGEIAERAAVLEHIGASDVVLEIGANVGGVSLLLASLLSSPLQLVSVDPHRGNCSHLKMLGLSIAKEFHVFHGVIKGPVDIECTGPEVIGSYVKCVPRSPSSLTFKTENLTIADLQTRFGLEFTAVVIDCEGCYETLMPQILSSQKIKQIQIEWDGKFLQDEILSAGFSLRANYVHKFLKRGVSVYKR